MKQITPKDIENPARPSGYTGVSYTQGGVGNRCKKPYHAQKRIGKSNGPGTRWAGPRRPLAAQDYCDYVNSNGQPVSRRLRSAGHKAPKRTPRTTGESAAARKLAKLRRECRELEAVVRAESKGSKGYVYCIGEYDGMLSHLRHNGVIFSPKAVKIGFAQKSPHQRLRELQTGNHRKLVLIGYRRGTLADEAKLHQEFIHHNVLGEWFLPVPRLLAKFTTRGH